MYQRWALRGIGTIFLPFVNKAVEELTKLLQKFQELPEDTRNAIIKIGGFGVVVGTAAALLLMFGGNLVWAVGQLILLGKSIGGFIISAGPVLTILGMIVAIFIAWGSVIAGVRGKFALLQVSANEFVANTIKNNLQGLTDLINLYVTFQNVLADVINTYAKLQGIQFEMTKLNKVSTKDLQLFGEGLDETNRKLRLEAESMARAQAWFDQGGPFGDLVNWVRGLAPEEGTAPGTQPFTGEAAPLTPGVGGETNMYGDLIINVDQPGVQGDVSMTDIERLIGVLSTHLQAETGQ